jgi:hypothetical protein
MGGATMTAIVRAGQHVEHDLCICARFDKLNDALEAIEGAA